MAEPPRKRQRRRLNYDKCQFCRNAKKACTPVERIWPQKCDRCAELELECSENSRAANSRPSRSIQPSDQVTGTSNIQKLHDLSLRVTWLRRLRFYEEASRAVLDAQEELWRQAPELNSMRQMLDFIQNEKTSLSVHFHDESTYSNNPLAALLLALLLNTAPASFQYYSTHPPFRAVSKATVDYARESGDIGTALALQESMLKRPVSFTANAYAIEVQTYQDIYLETMERLKTITGREVPVVPPLHNLLLLTQGHVIFPSSLDRTQRLREKDQLGRSLLHVALDLDILEDVLPNIEFDVASATEDGLGRWPIHIASSKNSTAAVEYLLKNKADVNVVDEHQRSALHYASTSANESIIRLLLKKGAEIDSADENGQTPLSWAAEKGHANIVQLLLKKGADIDSKHEDDQTPLSLAAYNGHADVVLLLLKEGANIDNKDISGRTPLSWAACNGHADVVLLLLKEGANIYYKDISGRTPLSWAACNGHAQVVRLLLKEGADMDSENPDDQTPLSWAAQRWHVDVVQLLPKKGANIDSEDMNGQTPLSLAAEKGHTDVVRLLLEKGANHSIENLGGHIPLHYALVYGHREVAELLRSSAVRETYDPSAVMVSMP